MEDEFFMSPCLYQSSNYSQSGNEYSYIQYTAGGSLILQYHLPDANINWELLFVSVFCFVNTQRDTYVRKPSWHAFRTSTYLINSLGKLWIIRKWHIMSFWKFQSWKYLCWSSAAEFFFYSSFGLIILDRSLKFLLANIFALVHLINSFNVSR